MSRKKNANPNGTNNNNNSTENRTTEEQPQSANQKKNSSRKRANARVFEHMEDLREWAVGDALPLPLPLVSCPLLFGPVLLISWLGECGGLFRFPDNQRNI